MCSGVMNLVSPVALFSPGMGEILVILVVALLLFGTKRLPSIARNLGRSLEEFRRAARDLSQEVLHAADEEDDSKRSLSAPRKPPEGAAPRSAPTRHTEPPPEDEAPNG